MDVFHSYRLLVKRQFFSRKVPKPSDTAGNQTLGNLSRVLLGQGENRHVDRDLGAEFLQLAHIADHNTSNRAADQRRIHVEHRNDVDTALFKHGCSYQGSAKVARSDDDGLQTCVHSQKLANILIKIINVVSVALLSKAAKAVEVLADL